MVRPVLVVNFKAYESAFGSKAREIARAASRYEGSTRIILAVPALVALDVARIHGDVYLQHVDRRGYGAFTGFIPVEAVAVEGLKGFLVNHSEHKILYRLLGELVEAARSLGVEVLACADTPGEAAGIAYLGPDMVALEPPELIGTGIPVSKAAPEVITRGVDAVKTVNPDVIVLAGAGINGGGDAVRALELGARGVLVASAVMKARDPASKIHELAEAMDSW